MQISIEEGNISINIYMNKYYRDNLKHLTSFKNIIIAWFLENSVDMMVPSLGNTNAAEKVRSFFPETWLWELELIG